MTFNIARRATGLAALALLFAWDAAPAQAQQRVRGTIEAVDGNTLSVRARDGAMLKVVLADNVSIIGTAKRSLADIKPGSFIGTAAVMEGSGPLRALEVHIFPENMRGAGEGHREWELANSSMTNAAVTDIVTSVTGNVFTLRYKGGEQKVMVTPQTPIVAFEPGERAHLKPGKAIFISGAKRADDGSLHTVRITVEHDAVPPM